MKKLIKDLVVGDKFYYCCGTYEVKEILGEGQMLGRKTTNDGHAYSWYALFSRTDEEVELVERIKLKDLSVGCRFRYVNNQYAHPRKRTILYKDVIAILYANDRGDYVLVKETDPANLWNEEVEVVPYDEEA